MVIWHVLLLLRSEVRIFISPFVVLKKKGEGETNQENHGPKNSPSSCEEDDPQSETKGKIIALCATQWATMLLSLEQCWNVTLSKPDDNKPIALVMFFIFVRSFEFLFKMLIISSASNSTSREMWSFLHVSHKCILISFQNYFSF